MSGTIGDNVYRASGVVAAASAGISWQSVVTASTLTAVAGNGYPIDTTSNACAITLPGSASVGDQIIFTDYARNWGTNKITLDSNGLNYQGQADTYVVQYITDGLSLAITYMDATNGWIPTTDAAVTDAPIKLNSEGIFAFGADDSNTPLSSSNLVSNTGVISADVVGVGTVRWNLSATQYGGDKGIFGFGFVQDVATYAETNLVSNAGVVASDQAAVTGTARQLAGGCSYSNMDKGIFGYGNTSATAVTNLVSNTGVVAADVTGVGTARYGLAACEYGGDKGIFGYGSGPVSMTNLVSNTGVVGTDVTGVGTARSEAVGCSYGTDKGIMGYGYESGSSTGVTNLVSSTGVVATDVAGVGTARYQLAACEYGYGKGIFGFGWGPTGITNLVSTAGVVSSDVAAVGTAKKKPGACSFN